MSIGADNICRHLGSLASTPIASNPHPHHAQVEEVVLVALVAGVVAVQVDGLDTPCALVLTKRRMMKIGKCMAYNVNVAYLKLPDTNY